MRGKVSGEFEALKQMRLHVGAYAPPLGAVSTANSRESKLNFSSPTLNKQRVNKQDSFSRSSEARYGISIIFLMMLFNLSENRFPLFGSHLLFNDALQLINARFTPLGLIACLE